jgi:Ferritin-like
VPVPFAELTRKDGTDEGLTAEQAEAVERWRQVLQGIAVEEMLHLALVSNVMASIGAAPTFGRPNFPQRSGYFPPSVQLDLLPFGEQALRHFLYLERPEGMERQDAEGFVPAAPPRDPLTADDLMPRGQEFLTIGHLHRGIEAGLTGRFLAIWEEHHALRERDPSFEPTRPVLVAYTRQAFDVPAEMPVIGDPLTRSVAELATVAYELVLQLLTRFFTHTDETDEQLEALVGGAIGPMADVVRPLGATLTRLPVGPGYEGRTAGFAFEVYYRMGNYIPVRSAARARLCERISFFAAKCAEIAAHDAAPDDVRGAGERATAILASLTPHVPVELRGSPAPPSRGRLPPRAGAPRRARPAGLPCPARAVRARRGRRGRRPARCR